MRKAENRYEIRICIVSRLEHTVELGVPSNNFFPRKAMPSLSNSSNLLPKITRHCQHNSALISAYNNPWNNKISWPIKIRGQQSISYSVKLISRSFVSFLKSENAIRKWFYQLWHLSLRFFPAIKVACNYWTSFCFLLYTYLNYKSIQAKLNQNHQFSLTLIPKMRGFLMVGYSWEHVKNSTVHNLVVNKELVMAVVESSRTRQ